MIAKQTQSNEHVPDDAYPLPHLYASRLAHSDFSKVSWATAPTNPLSISICHDRKPVAIPPASTTALHALPTDILTFRLLPCVYVGTVPSAALHGRQES
jgi:hypothetical protein